MELSPQQWQQIIAAAITIATAILTWYSRKNERPRYAETRMEVQPSQNGNGNAVKALTQVNEGTIARLERNEDDILSLTRRVDSMEADNRSWRLDAMRSLGDIITARTQPIERRLDAIESEKRTLAAERDYRDNLVIEAKRKRETDQLPKATRPEDTTPPKGDDAA